MYEELKGMVGPLEKLSSSGTGYVGWRAAITNLAASMSAPVVVQRWQEDTENKAAALLFAALQKKQPACAFVVVARPWHLYHASKDYKVYEVGAYIYLLRLEDAELGDWIHPEVLPEFARDELYTLAPRYYGDDRRTFQWLENCWVRIW